MSEEVEKLYNALTYIDDDLILEAGKPARPGHWKTFQMQNFAGRAGRMFKTAFVRVAVACFILMISMATALAASPALRETVVDLIVGFSDNGIRIEIIQTDDGQQVGTEEQTDRDLPFVTLGWLPEGGILTVDETDPAVHVLNVEYADGSSIEVCVGDFFVSTLVSEITTDIEDDVEDEAEDNANAATSDTAEEGEDSEENHGEETQATEANDGSEAAADDKTTEDSIQIQGHEASLSIWKDQVLIFWYDGEYEVMVSVHTQGIDEEDAIRIADEMVVG